MLAQQERHLYLTGNTDPPLVRFHHTFALSPCFSETLPRLIFSALTCNLYATIKCYDGANQRKKMLKRGSVALPVVLLILAYVLDSEDNMKYEDLNIENAVLNVSRHAFSCSMRFQNGVRHFFIFILLSLCLFYLRPLALKCVGQAIEWALLWVHFLWSGSGIIVFSMLSWKDVGVVRAPYMLLHFSMVSV